MAPCCGHASLAPMLLCEHEHSFNVVNIRGVVYLVDAYVSPVLLTTKLEGYLRYAKKLEITFKVQMKIVPADQAAKVTCPEPAAKAR